MRHLRPCSLDSLSEPVDRGRRLLAISAGVGIVVAGLLLATSFSLPMAWDEGNAILRADAMWQGEWRYTTQIEGHPAFYGIVITLGRWVSWWWLPPLASYRFGPQMLFALAVGGMYYRTARWFNHASALGAVGALILLPRLFAHAHFALCDGPLTACWVLAWVAFDPARRRPTWAVVWGVMLGMTLATKATGWIAPVPFVVWTLLYRDRRGLQALAMGLPVAAGVFLLLNPPLWHHPIDGFLTFLKLNFHRGQFNIPIQFFGRMYNLDHPLPWYNTLVWVGVTVPVGLLALLGVGMGEVARGARRRPEMVLLALHAVVLLVVRALPGTPPHDGVRLFLPSFAFLAALMGLGAGRLFVAARLRAKRAERRSARLALGLVVSIYLGSATSLIWYSPQWLSYYNLILGGLPRATAMGMEPTYYWDALDQPTLDWLAQNTAEGEKVWFAASSHENLYLLTRWGRLNVAYHPQSPGQWRWYVLQHRPSAHVEVDRWLIEQVEPAHRKTIRASGWGPWRLTVPLVEVYPVKVE